MADEVCQVRSLLPQDCRTSSRGRRFLLPGFEAGLNKKKKKKQHARSLFPNRWETRCLNPDKNKGIILSQPVARSRRWK